MSVSRLPNGRWRAQVYHKGKTVSAAKVLGLPPEQSTFSSQRKAQDAVAAARKALASTRASDITIREWSGTWLTDPFWDRPKESTNRMRRQRMRLFVERYGDLPLHKFGDRQVGEVLRGRRDVMATVRSMFHDAMSPEAGRLLERDPFVGVRAKKQPAKHVDPPGPDVVWELIRVARERVNPGFAAWLQVAAFTGLRPGELDGLRWSSVDFGRERIRVVEQFNRTSRSRTLPKTGVVREAILTPPAREALEGLWRGSEFCFTNLHGRPWTDSARAKHWNKVRKAVGYTGTLYNATRHFSGWYMTNVLGLADSVVAIALGHEDGGKLVRTTYGHRDKDLVLAEALRAYESASVTRLRVVQ